MNTAIDIHRHVAPLHERVTLVELSRSRWGATTLDKEATKKLLAANNARNGAARVNKSVLAGCVQLDTVNKYYRDIYNKHAYMTQAFNDSGLRVLCNLMYPEYTKVISGMITEWNGLVEDFLIAYQFEKLEAQHVQGGLYDPADYPDEDIVRGKFDIRYKLYPMPTSGNWALDMSSDVTEDIMTRFNADMADMETRLLGDTWEHARKVLLNMSTQLGSYDLKDKPKLYDTLVTNVTDVADLMEKCNPTNDPKMEMARIEIMEAMRGVNKDALKEDRGLRTETKKAVDTILSTLPTLDF